MNDISVATPSALVVSCLLTNIGRYEECKLVNLILVLLLSFRGLTFSGLGRSELIDRVVWFRNQIKMRGGHISVFGQGNASMRLRYSLSCCSLLGSIVDKVTFLLSNCIDRQVR